MAEHARILAVDDEAAVQQALACALERYEVARSGDGGDALARARRGLL
jgi:CheY-like chemotaxis protein